MEAFHEVVLSKNNLFRVESLYSRNFLARLAVYYCFILEGTFAGVWGRYIPEIQDKLDISDSLLGTSVLFYYLGNVFGAPIDAFLVKRFGSRFATTLGAWGFIASLPLVGLANNFGVLCVATLSFGLSCGVMDIAMNSSAILTEIVANIPLLGSFHGSYSIAAALGSLIGGVFIQSGLSSFPTFGICSSIAILFSLATFFSMYDKQQEDYLTSFHKDHDDKQVEVDEEDRIQVLLGNPISEGVAEQDMASPLLANTEQRVYDQSLKPNGSKGVSTLPATSQDWKILLTFAAAGFFASFGESSVVTWSTVYFDRDIHASSVVKSLGLTCFMVCMGCGRFACDYLRRVIGRHIIIRIGGVLAMTGLIIAVLSTALPSPVAFACIGFACTGLGLSTIIPTVFSSAGHLPGMHGGTAVAIVAGCTYCGSIISPPLIGLLSDAFGSLRMAILCDGLILGLIIPISFGVIPETMVFHGHEQNPDGEVEKAQAQVISG